MIRFKEGVSLDRLTPPTLTGLASIVALYDEMGCDCYITSGSEGDTDDGVHMPTSYHYQGRACDVRMWNVPKHLREELFRNIQKKLGDDFDCIFYTKTQHFHMEHDPEE